MTSFQRLLLIYDTEKIGSKNQCLALADALQLLSQSFPKPNVTTTVLAVPAFGVLKLFPKVLWQFFNPCKDLINGYDDRVDLIISSGTRAAVVALGIKENLQKGASNGRVKCINILNPRYAHREFDWIITPCHDHLDEKNIISTLGPLTKVIDLPLKINNSSGDKKTITVLIGGPSKHTNLDLDALRDLVSLIKGERGAFTKRFWISFSRRTPETLKKEILKLLKDQENVSIYDPADPQNEDNPFDAYLKNSDIFVVTADSMSMICECASAGGTTYVLKPRSIKRKAQEFLGNLVLRNHVSYFEGNFNSIAQAPLRETIDVAKRILMEDTGLIE